MTLFCQYWVQSLLRELDPTCGCILHATTKIKGPQASTKTWRGQRDAVISDTDQWGEEISQE